MPIPTWTTGQILTASDVDSWFVPLFAYKTANTARPSNTTPSADPHLTVTVAANAVYRMHALLFYGATSTGDLLVQWSGPSGTAGTWADRGPGTTVISSSASPTLQANTVSTAGYMIRSESTDISASRTFGGVTSSDIFAVECLGLFRIGSTAGSFTMTWAQAVSDATATTVYLDSWLELQRVG